MSIRKNMVFILRHSVALALVIAACALPIVLAQDAPKPAETEKPADAPKPAAPRPASPRGPVAGYEDMMSKPIGEHVLEVSDVKYVEGESAHERHVLDLYLPKEKKDFPVVVFVHGGTWYEGEKRHGKAIARGLVAKGYGVASINYRLANVVGNGAKFPEFVEDAAAAFAWVHKNIAKHGGDPKQLFVSGHSAGGHIAGLIAYDESYLKKHELENSSVIRGFIGLSGAYDIPTTDTDDPFLKAMAGMITFAFAPDSDTRVKASPSSHTTREDPPTLLLYAEKELFGLEKSTINLRDKATAAGIRRRVKKLDGRSHITILGEFGSEGDKAAQYASEFIAEILKGTFKGDEDIPAAGVVDAGGNGNGAASKPTVAKPDGSKPEPADRKPDAAKPVDSDAPVPAGAGR